MSTLTLEPIKVDEDKPKGVYPSDNCRIVLKMWEDYYPKIGFHFPWIGFFIIKDKQFVGTCGFTGPPINNRVEVTYTTFKEFEGQGIATYACGQLIKLTKSKKPDLIIVAKTAPENNASTKVLQRNGFVRSGIVRDSQVGDAWKWILK